MGDETGRWLRDGVCGRKEGTRTPPRGGLSDTSAPTLDHNLSFNYLNGNGGWMGGGEKPNREGRRESRHCFLSQRLLLTASSSLTACCPGCPPAAHLLGNSPIPTVLPFAPHQQKAWPVQRRSTPRCPRHDASLPSPFTGMLPSRAGKGDPVGRDAVGQAQPARRGLHAKERMKMPKETKRKQLNKTARCHQDQCH